MKSILVLVFALGWHASGYFIDVPKSHVPPRFATTSGWIHRQKLILALFENTCEDSIDPIIVRLSNEFTFEDVGDNFTKPEVVINLKNLIDGKGLITKGTIFTEFNKDHIFELKAVYDVLYNAKGFHTFYVTASWARQNVNCALFIDAIYAVLLHRRDTAEMALPPPYELLPNYFIRKDAIIKGSLLLGGNEIIDSDDVHGEGNTYTIDANYTADFIENEDESKMAYFLEDIGLNSYYFLKRVQNSPWVETENDIKRGEYWYYFIKQLVARYNLERYANGFSEIQSTIWDSLPNVKYDPMLMYSNGYDFPEKTMPVNFENRPEYTYLRNIEDNIATIASHWVQKGYNKREIVNNLMEMLVFEENSYEAMALKLLAPNDNSTNQCPSVLEHYLTMLRDPIYWKICKRIITVIEKATSVLPSYTRNELYFPGVEVKNVLIKKMLTNCDLYEFDATDALKSNQSQSIFQIKIGQPRLNHKPFTIKLNVSSMVSQKGLIKIYLTPKMLPSELSVKKDNFFLIDFFEFTLKSGSNIITRTSDQLQGLSNDLLSVKSLLKIVEDAEFGLESLTLRNIESYVGFPSRLILPKGSSSGLSYQIFAFVAPFVKTSKRDLYASEFNSAILSPAYPFDLINDNNQLFELPNAMFKEIVITHKGDNKVFSYAGAESTKQWGGSTYDPSSRPRFDYSSKQQSSPFDYNAKKGQYGKKIDNVGKRGGLYKVQTTTEYVGLKSDDIEITTFMQEKDVRSFVETNTNDDFILNKYNTIDDNDINRFPATDTNQDNLKITEQEKKASSVYDIYRRLDNNYDDLDDRVYE